MKPDKTLSITTTWILFSIIGIASVVAVSYALWLLIPELDAAYPHRLPTGTARNPGVLLIPLLSWGLANGSVAFLDTVFGLGPASLLGTGKA